MGKKIPITDQILNSVNITVDHYGSVLALAKAIDVSNTTVRDWILKKSKYIHRDTFIRLISEMKPYISTGEYENYLNMVGKEIRKECRFEPVATFHPDGKKEEYLTQKERENALIDFYLSLEENIELRKDILNKAQDALIKDLIINRCLGGKRR